MSEINRIHPDTTLGAVHLTVKDLARSLDFYQQSLGFRVHNTEPSIAHLGAGNATLVSLYENKQARFYPKTTGLYHFAVLVPSRLQLAYSLQNLAETRTQVQGFADHLVSEAIYLADPDGNGIEIYRDRTRDAWEITNGQLKMGSEPLDIESILGELQGTDGVWSNLDPATIIGHMHLHVAAIQEAEDFYHEVLGFDKILRYGPSASFLSAGGYHHHIGLNTWNGVGAPQPPPDALGLRYFEIQYPSDDALQSAINLIQKSEVPIQKQDNGWLVRDPSGNTALLRK